MGLGREGSLTVYRLQGVLEEALLFFHTKPLAVPLPVLQRFPSLVQLDTAPQVQDVGASRSLAVSLLSALRANGELRAGGAEAPLTHPNHILSAPCPLRNRGSPHWCSLSASWLCPQHHELHKGTRGTQTMV